MKQWPIVIKRKSSFDPWLHCCSFMGCLPKFWPYSQKSIAKKKPCFLGLIGSGRTNVSTVASIAQAQNRDGQPVDAVAAFASLGSFGTCASNQERDMHRWLRNLHGTNLDMYYTPFELEVGLPVGFAWVLSYKKRCWRKINVVSVALFCSVWVPTQVRDETDTKTMLIPTLLPHEILHAVAAAGQEQARFLTETKWFPGFKNHRVFSYMSIYMCNMYTYVFMCIYIYYVYTVLLHQCSQPC